MSSVHGERRMWARAVVAVVVTTIVTMVALAAPASAHPLGNFTVNRYARVEVSGEVVRVYYVLDEAEIPAFQDRDALRADRSGFVRARLDRIRRNLTLAVDGGRLPLRVVDSLLTEPAGQGGLPTLRLAAVLEARLPPGQPEARHAAVFVDANEPNRIGWREIVVRSVAAGRLLRSDAPAEGLSNELRSYPADLVQAPLDLRRATFEFVPGARTAPAAALRSPDAAPDRSGGGFTRLVDRQDLTPFVVIGMLALAALFGAVHALAPGHGKTVMAAYLVGTRGRARDAVLLGVIVSAMHTASVLVLGLVLYRISRDAALDRIYPWLKVASGLIVVGFGIWMVRDRLRARRRRVQATAHHHHDEHDHHDHHDHHGGHGGHGLHGGHSHELPEDVAPLSRRGLVVLATAGGIFPSPSALIVLVSAFTLRRPVLGLSLVGAFSVGLAVTLTTVGLLLVAGKSLASRRPALGRVLPALPILSAFAITVVGAFLLFQGFTTIN